MKPEFTVLYESGGVLAVDKPAGVATQAPEPFDSLERRVRRWLAQRAGEEWVYLGVPHRLDRPVGGCILFATKRRAAFKLSRQFERRTVVKRYWACAGGHVEPIAGTWTDHVWKVYGQPRAMVVAADHPGAQTAVLHYRVIGEHGHGSWLEIELETGRTHQIRLQASSRGYAIVGDTFYGSEIPFGDPTADERERPIALHARSIEFADPQSGERIRIESPLPETWNSLNLRPVSADD